MGPVELVVGWLPIFHDMGLIGNVLQGLCAGSGLVLMSPVAFLKRPARWLEAVSYTHLLEMAKRCIDTYAAITKAGVPATEVVPAETVTIGGKDQVFGGAIEAIRVKHCDGPYQKYADEQAQREAPYRKVLKLSLIHI